MLTHVQVALGLLLMALLGLACGINVGRWQAGGRQSWFALIFCMAMGVSFVYWALA